MRIGAWATLLVVLAMPAPVSAWGFEAHKFIMRRALDLLPPALKPFYDKNRDEVVLRVTDPDLWRNVGWNEDHNHFIDFGAKEYGTFPFAALPRELGAATEKFGTATLERNGMLPWRAAELFGNLRRTFESFGRGQFAASDAVLFSGAVAHYFQDAHQPLHATINFDGQLTDNAGIHTRFERDLFEKFQSRLTVTARPPAAIKSPRDAAFDALLESYQLVDQILKADTEAAAGKDTYDDDYYDKLFARLRPMIERRLGDAITATASVIVAAWEQAGRPALDLAPARSPQKIRKPQP
jgi:hypothetical protein